MYLHLMLIQQVVGNETVSLVVRSFSNPDYSSRLVSNSEHWSHTSNMENVAMMAGFRYQLDPTQNHLGRVSVKARGELSRRKDAPFTNALRKEGLCHIRSLLHNCR